MIPFIAFFYFAITASFHRTNGEIFKYKEHKIRVNPEAQIYMNILMEMAVAKLNEQFIRNAETRIRIPSITKEITFGDGLVPRISYFNATNGFFSYDSGLNVTSKAELWSFYKDVKTYIISCSTKILRPRIHYDFNLKVGTLEGTGAINGYTDETFLKSKLNFGYSGPDAGVTLDLHEGTLKNITMVIENLGQLEFLSDHLNTLINIEWKKKIASSVKEEYVLNMYKNLGKLDIDKFRPFA